MEETRKPVQLLKKAVKVLGQPLIATLLGLLVGLIVIIIAGENPFFVYAQMFEKSFFNVYYLMQTLTRSAPIIVCSIAIIIAWRAGYINLGVEGQMIVGALVATATAIYVPGPTPVVLFLAIILGMAAGALYALFAAYIYSKFEVSIVISTLMMNYIATYISSYFVTFPLRDQSGTLSIQTREIPKSMRFLRIFEGHTFNIGFFLAIFIVLLVLFIIKKTSFGYESKMTGLNRVFAEYGGIKKNSVMLKTMALSGAVAAFAGIIEIFGLKYRFVDNMFGSTSYAWTGLMAALISNLHPVGALFTSIFLSGLQVGGQAIQRTTNIPLQVATLIQTTITLFVSVQLIIRFKKHKRDKKTDVTAPCSPAKKAKAGDS